MIEGGFTLGDICTVEDFEKFHEWEGCKKCEHYKKEQMINLLVLKKERGRELYIYGFNETCPREHGLDTETAGKCYAYELLRNHESRF